MDTHSLLTYVGIALGAIPTLSAAATSFVGLWHSLVGLLHLIGSLPGLSGVNSVADRLKVTGDQIDGQVSDHIVPLLNRLSGLPLPHISMPGAQASPVVAPAPDQVAK